MLSQTSHSARLINGVSSGSGRDRPPAIDASSVVLEGTYSEALKSLPTEPTRSEWQPILTSEDVEV